MSQMQQQYDESAAFDYDFSAADLAKMGFSAVPVAGPAKDAYDDYQEGNYGWAAANGVFAVIDGVTLGADEELSGPAKAGIKGSRIAAKVTEKALSGFRKTLSEGGRLRAGDKAHHIVEKGDKAAELSRQILDKYGIGIHSFDNGIGLSAHAGRHSNAYSQAVLNRIANLRSADAIKQELAKIAKELRKYDDAGKKVNDWAKDQIKK
jgi:hypothetical protein